MQLHTKIKSPAYRHLCCLVLLTAILLANMSATAAITVQIGPTDIPRGEANGEQDITVNNGLFALAFAVDSAPPWGVARGGIVDVAIVSNGRVGNDIASLVDFMPNNWSAWPTSYQQVDIVKQTDGELIIRTRRNWGEVELETHFQLRENDRRVHISTTMFNKSSRTLPDLLTGYVMWPDGGYLFGVPGLHRQVAAEEHQALADWSAAYDHNWVLGLHAPFASHLRYTGRDRYLQHALEPGEKQTFEAWLQIEQSGDLAPLVRTEIESRQLPSGTLSGEVRSSDGKRVDQPAVVILKNGKPYAWTLGMAGRYAMELPAGDYTVYATAQAYAPGPVQSISLTAGSETELNHTGLQAPGSVLFAVKDSDSGKPLDARISVLQGHKPLIEFLGDKTFFTDLERLGTAAFSVAPGRYEFEVSAGGGFTAAPQRLTTQIKSDAENQVNSEISVQHHPSRQHWYAIDLHHHSDVLDGFTAPEFVLRSELAAGMDFSFLSDHDSMANNPEMKRLSATRSLPFLAATELSPSWAHFNAYPVMDNGEIDIDIGTATVQEIFALARRLGAQLVHVNHPYGDYGYFRSLETRVERDGKAGSAVPGDYDPGFDLVEITVGDNSETLARVWQLWNSGHRAYLVGGSDVHDVWNEVSGASRTFVHIKTSPELEGLLAALNKGQTYATQGPLIFPEIIFGSEIKHKAGTPLALTYQLAAVSGLRSVALIERGKTKQTRDYEQALASGSQTFEVHPRADTWYSLIVEDAKGKFAYSNPVWVSVIK